MKETIKLNERLEVILFLYEQGRTSQGDKLYHELIRDNPKNDNIHYMLGVIDFQIKRYQSSCDRLYQAIRLNPSVIRYYNVLCTSLLIIERNNEAFVVINQALSKFPDNPELLFTFGNVLYCQNKIDESLEPYMKAMQFGFDHIDLFLSIGLVYLHQKNYNKAIEFHHKALLIHPNNYQAYQLLGLTYEKNLRMEDAKKAYRNFFIFMPDETWHNRINKFIVPRVTHESMEKNDDPNQDHIDSTQDSDSEQIVNRSTLVESYNNMGVMFNNEGKPQKAIESFKKALAINPDLEELYNNMGYSYYLIGQHSKAIAAFEKSMAMNPNYINPLYNLARIYMDNRMDDQAIELLKKALVLEPENIKCIIQIANIQIMNHHLSEAEQLLNRALIIDPNHKIVQHILAAITSQPNEYGPNEYTTHLFDHYAHKFDTHLLKALDYQIPIYLKRATQSVIPKDTLLKNCLDIGCGTGLTGIAFQDIVENMVGVDLSSNMIQKAFEKNIYQNIYHSDIIDFLENCVDLFDLFIAADVFIYMGRVDKLFEYIKVCAGQCSWFAFSVETSHTSDVLLNTSGRFSHSHHYIETLCQTHGFSIELCLSAGIRKEQDHWIPGALYVIKIR